MVGSNVQSGCRERPILFSGPMVRAILSGQKTQTRRVIDPQPSMETGGYWCCVSSTERSSVGKWTPRIFSKCPRDGSDNPATGESIKCRYGDVGDHLWVRESLRYSVEHDNHYWAADSQGVGNRTHAGLPKKSIPSIHMPRWASRITLEITGIRVERLNDISEEDAKAEGYPGTEVDGRHIPWSERGWFQSLWESINGDGSWAANPWVWVVEFRKV